MRFAALLVPSDLVAEVSPLDRFLIIGALMQAGATSIDRLYLELSEQLIEVFNPRESDPTAFNHSINREKGLLQMNVFAFGDKLDTIDGARHDVVESDVRLPDRCTRVLWGLNELRDRVRAIRPLPGPVARLKRRC